MVTGVLVVLIGICVCAVDCESPADAVDAREEFAAVGLFGAVGTALGGARAASGFTAALGFRAALAAGPVRGMDPLAAGLEACDGVPAGARFGGLPDGVGGAGCASGFAAAL